jgi:hypothetical protein
LRTTTGGSRAAAREVRGRGFWLNLQGTLHGDGQGPRSCLRELMLSCSDSPAQSAVPSACSYVSREAGVERFQAAARAWSGR